MKKRDREQLRASIAKDLVQGQGVHSPTKELLRQYTPLEGVITTPAPDVSRRSGSAHPVENSLAPHATVAQKEHSPWHSATVAPPATVERLATVKGELRVPNTINFSLFPTLEPFAKAVYYSSFFYRTASGETRASSVSQSWQNWCSCRKERSRTQSLTWKREG